MSTGDYSLTCGKQLVHLDFARQLETELNEANAVLSQPTPSVVSKAEHDKVVQAMADTINEGARQVEVSDRLNRELMAKLRTIETEAEKLAMALVKVAIYAEAPDCIHRGIRKDVADALATYRTNYPKL